jgi:hypothetical protein
VKPPRPGIWDALGRAKWSGSLSNYQHMLLVLSLTLQGCVGKAPRPGTTRGQVDVHTGSDEGMVGIRPYAYRPAEDDLH